MVKRALIIHPTHDDNCGDLITYYGAKALLAEALGGYQNLDVVQFDEARAEREKDTYITEYCWGEDIDIIVLASSIWLWDLCELSDKFVMLSKAIERFPKAKKIALGLGSCFPKEGYDYYFKNNIESTRNFFDVEASKDKSKLGYKIFSSFDYISTRDLLTYKLLENAGIKSAYSVPSSVFFPMNTKKRQSTDKSVLWFSDPTKGISKDSFVDNTSYVDYQIQWAKDNKADIYCNTAGDKSTLIELGIKGNYSTDLQFLSKHLQSYSNMLSSRLQISILGHLGGIENVTLLATDSRALSVQGLPINIQYIDTPWVEYQPVIPQVKSKKVIIQDLKLILGA